MDSKMRLLYIKPSLAWVSVPLGAKVGRHICSKVFISDVNPSENTKKYIDDTTVYDTMTKTDINIPEKIRL
mgnify:CR=1 FL=1